MKQEKDAASQDQELPQRVKQLNKTIQDDREYNTMLLEKLDKKQDEKSRLTMISDEQESKLK